MSRWFDPRSTIPMKFVVRDREKKRYTILLSCHCYWRSCFVSKKSKDEVRQIPLSFFLQNFHGADR